MNSSLMLGNKIVRVIKQIADLGGMNPTQPALQSRVTANWSTNVAGVPRRFRWVSREAPRTAFPVGDWERGKR